VHTARSKHPTWHVFITQSSLALSGTPVKLRTQPDAEIAVFAMAAGPAESKSFEFRIQIVEFRVPAGSIGWQIRCTAHAH
jgi:hypothetical protein